MFNDVSKRLFSSRICLRHDQDALRCSNDILRKYFKDPSNKDLKFLRTKVRNLKKPLEKSGIKYEQIFRSIQNLSFSKKTLENYLDSIFKKIIKKKNNEISLNFKKYMELSHDIKLALINESIKILRKNLTMPMNDEHA